MSNKMKSIVVTVSDEALSNIYQLADRLAAEGMKIDRVMPVTGVITGSSPANKVSSLKKVTGVASLEEELAASLPPPDSTLQ